MSFIEKVIQKFDSITKEPIVLRIDFNTNRNCCANRIIVLENKINHVERSSYPNWIEMEIPK